MTRRSPLLWIIALTLTACKREEAATDEGAAPPPLASSKPGICTTSPGKVGDEATAAYFPQTSGDYCVDPNSETRAYGEGAKGTLDEVCTQQFDGECEVYKSYGLRRVVTLRYVDGKGSPGAIAVTLSRFGSNEGAYGFFTKRVIADGDPVDVAPEILEAGGAGALGSGIAYVWRGEHVAEVSYTNELEPPEKIRESSRRVLPPLAKTIGEKLPGPTTLPLAATLLPAEHRVPLGIRYEYQDVLDIAGVGRGAIGYYKNGDKRWRTFVVVRPDEDAAKDVTQTMKKLEGVTGIKEAPFPALVVPRQRSETGPRVEWIVARGGARIYGVGDEELVLTADLPPEKQALVKLSREEKLSILKAFGPAGE